MLFAVKEEGSFNLIKKTLCIIDKISRVFAEFEVILFRSVQVLFPPKTVGPANTALHGITLSAGLTHAMAVMCHCCWWTMTVFLGTSLK